MISWGCWWWDVVVSQSLQEPSREELLALLAARDELLASRDVRIDALLVQVEALTAQVQELVLRLGKDSATSSKPPSSDPPARRVRGGSSRQRSGRGPGKQPGDPGVGLRQVDDPDVVVQIPAPVRCGCGCSLVEVAVEARRRRQVFEVSPPPPVVVTEYAAALKRCPACGGRAVGVFPVGVKAPVQYGPRVAAVAAEVVLAHHVPIARGTELVADLCGVRVSTGFVAGIRSRAARAVEAGGFLQAVRVLLAGAPVVHADETFARAEGGLSYVHVAATEHLTLLHTGNRSAAAIDAGGVLPELGSGQVLVRDGYAGYAHLKDVEHAWCAAHLLRDLRGIHEADPGAQVWAKAMADALLSGNDWAHEARAMGREQLDVERLALLGRLYTGALARGRSENPATDRSPLARQARTLIDRFDKHREQVLRFATDLGVPFTNNQAERDVRPVKVQQRSSGGCWRRIQGLADFTVVQSYLSTAKKWGVSRMDALLRLFTTGPWLPPALAPTVITN